MMTTTARMPASIADRAKGRRYRQRPRVLPFGSVSHGTMRNEDVIPALLSAAEDVRMSRADRAKVRALSAEWRKLNDLDDGDMTDRDGDADDLCSDLFDILNNYCPSYAYFGAHPGDGSDYGVWLSEDFDEEFQTSTGPGHSDHIKVNDLSELPKGFTGEALQVSDHGNPTLYAVHRGRARVVWALV